MTSSLQGHLNLVIQEESIFDNVYKDLKGLIKSRKDILTQAIEEEKEMDEEEMKACQFFDKESESLIQSLQVVNALLENQKERLENFGNGRRERQSEELWKAVINYNLPKAKVLLTKENVDINWQNPDDRERTALMRAAFDRNLEMAKLLIINKADVHIRNKDGSTALNFAYDSIDMTKLLVAKGANVDNQTNDGETALINACLEGHQDVASFLLAEGASHTFKNHFGSTAGDYALGNGWNWDAMVAEANLSYFDHVFDCMVNADYSPLVEKKKGRKRKRGEEEEEKKEELPFLLRFMKKVVNSDFMMSKNVFPKLSFNPGAEAGEGMTEF